MVGFSQLTVAAPRKLSLVVLAEMFLRSLFLQSQWNFQRMQNLGWLYSLWPALRRLYPDRERRAKVALEHMEYFNSHPYLTNIILGTVAGLEEEHALGGPVAREQIRAAKKFMSGPLAALGDSVFWATARPVFGVMALALGMAFVPEKTLIVPLLFLFFHNTLHLVVRVGGLWTGYKLKAQVVAFLIRLNLQSVVRACAFLGIGLCLGILLVLGWGFGSGWGWCVGVFFASFLALRIGLTSTKLFYALVVVGIVVGLIFRP